MITTRLLRGGLVLCAVGALNVARPAVAAPVFDASAWAHGYTQTDGGEDSQSRPNTTTPAVADWTMTDAGGNVAAARARAAGLGPSGAYARVTGNADVPGAVFRDIEAEGSADAWVTFRVTSDTLPAGAPVVVRLDVAYDGRLEVRNPGNVSVGGEFDELVAINALIEVVPASPDEEPVSPYEAYAGFYGDGAFYDGDVWADKFTRGTDAATGTTWAALDVTDSTTFDARVGSEYTIQTTLLATARLTSGLPVELVSDFYNTSTFSLAPQSGGDFQIAFVPEPATAATLLMSAGGLMFRRRPRG